MVMTKVGRGHTASAWVCKCELRRNGLKKKSECGWDGGSTLSAVHRHFLCERVLRLQQRPGEARNNPACSLINHQARDPPVHVQIIMNIFKAFRRKFVPGTMAVSLLQRVRKRNMIYSVLCCHRSKSPSHTCGVWRRHVWQEPRAEFNFNHCCLRCISISRHKGDKYNVVASIGTLKKTSFPSVQRRKQTNCEDERAGKWANAGILPVTPVRNIVRPFYVARYNQTTDQVNWHHVMDSRSKMLPNKQLNQLLIEFINHFLGV